MRQSLCYFYEDLFGIGKAPVFQHLFKSLYGIPCEYSPLIKWSKGILTDYQKYILFQNVVFAYIKKPDLELLYDFIELSYTKSSKAQNINKAFRIVCDENGDRKEIPAAIEIVQPSKLKKIIRRTGRGKVKVAAIARLKSPKTSIKVKVAKRKANRGMVKSVDITKNSKSTPTKRNRDWGGDTCMKSTKKSKSMTNVELKVISEMIIDKMYDIVACNFLNMQTTTTKSLCVFCAFSTRDKNGHPLSINSISNDTPAESQLDVDYLCLHFLEQMFGERDLMRVGIFARMFIVVDQCNLHLKESQIILIPFILIVNCLHR